MPKGRGANERRRSYRQKHPKDKNTNRGALMLEALYQRAGEVAKRRKRGRK